MANKILIVDDDIEFRNELRAWLEGYEVVEASDGKEALEMLKRPNEIDLVFLDVKMPGLSGMEVLEKIKKINPDLGIVMLTAYSSKDIVIKALKNRADDYLEKPLDIDKIKEVIEKILESKHSGSDINVINLKSKIEKVKRFIERNCYKKICLKDVSEIVCLSPKYLSRIFKQVSGENFNEYKIGVKIEKAKELLIKTGYNVDQIADKLGYGNTGSFIKQFNKLAKCTPTEYRKKMHKIKKSAYLLDWTSRRGVFRTHRRSDVAK
jgi:YesN/AraC family two-component response regulator